MVHCAYSQWNIGRRQTISLVQIPRRSSSPGRATRRKDRKRESGDSAGHCRVNFNCPVGHIINDTADAAARNYFGLGLRRTRRSRARRPTGPRAIDGSNQFTSRCTIRHPSFRHSRAKVPGGISFGTIYHAYKMKNL